MTCRDPITVNPVESWFNPLEPGSEMQIQTVRDFANQAAGKLRAQADAAAQESGPIWWIARFVRLPVEVRDAAGLSSKAGQSAAAGIGVFVQGVAIAVVAGLVLLLFQAILQSWAISPRRGSHPPPTAPFEDPIPGLDQ